jgi:hypothetical protein
MLATVNLFAGLAFNPGIRGILVVAVGVAVLMGSVYILLATNTGARLGMLLALTGLFGWLTVLTLFWWLSPPAIGPRGNNASWRPVEIIVNDGSVPKTEVVSTLINPNDLPTPEHPPGRPALRRPQRVASHAVVLGRRGPGRGRHRPHRRQDLHGEHRVQEAQRLGVRRQAHPPRVLP